MTEKRYRLTPKGLLFNKMTQAKNGEETDMESAWNDLVLFVERRMAEDGMTGIPCIVLERGGICISVEKQKGPTRED